MKKQSEQRWNLWSSQGSVLFYVATNPDATVREIASGVGLTQRTIWDIVGALCRAGMIESHKDSRRNRYRVNLDAPFKHPTIRGVTLRTLLANLPQNGAREETRASAAN